MKINYSKIIKNIYISFYNYNNNNNFVLLLFIIMKIVNTIFLLVFIKILRLLF